MDEAPSPSPAHPFDTVPVRDRHDGWTPERQHAFIAALAESGCVVDACRAVGMTSQSAYRLRRHFDAQGFRLAWDAALDYAIGRLSDAALSRAINGVPVPHYYKGELVGEHRRYDERLTSFLLRYRDPMRYAKAFDRQEPLPGSPELFAVRLARLMLHVESGDPSLLVPVPPARKKKRRRRRRRRDAPGDGASPL